MSYEEENNSKEFPVQFGHGSHGFKDHKLKSTPKTDRQTQDQRGCEGSFAEQNVDAGLTKQYGDHVFPKREKNTPLTWN